MQKNTGDLFVGFFISDYFISTNIQEVYPRASALGRMVLTWMIPPYQKHPKGLKASKKTQKNNFQKYEKKLKSFIPPQFKRCI